MPATWNDARDGRSGVGRSVWLDHFGRGAQGLVDSGVVRPCAATPLLDSGVVRPCAAMPLLRFRALSWIDFQIVGTILCQ
jgi:hypothetical protein